jgi:hypothetical protein
MEFVTQSLPEAAYLYTGLALQALTRGALRHVPAAIVILNTMVLITRSGLASDPRLFARALGYFCTSAFILILFWPEAVGRFGRGAALDATQVGSYAALQDPGARVLTAQDTGLVPSPLQGSAVLPPGLRLLLRAFTETPLALARVFNREAHRPFSAVVPMQWLLTYPVAGEAEAAVRDFVHGCFLPAKTRLLQTHTGAPLTFQALLPWGGTPLEVELALVEVTPGAQTGLMGFFATLWGSSPTPVRCHDYFQRVDQEVQAWIANHRTERGTPLSQVFQDELGLSLPDQARFLIYREMLRAAGPEIPAPSLTGQYFLLRGAGVLGSLATGSGEGATRGSRFFGGTPGLGKGAAGGALVGAIQGAGNVFQHMFDTLEALVRPAVFLTWWGPYILGIVNLVILGLFPFVLIWSLFPRAQFQPLAAYFAVLFFTSSTPLWWALVDVAARLAGGVGPPLFWDDPAAWAQAHVAAPLVVTAVGILLVPVIMGLLIFGSWRAISGLWRGMP